MAKAKIAKHFFGLVKYRYCLRAGDIIRQGRFVWEKAENEERAMASLKH
jgi:hypothetical protein